MSTIHDPRYIQLIKELVDARKKRNLTQIMLAEKLKQQQSYIAKVEGLERRLDIIELLDWLEALDYTPHEFFEDIGWFPREGKVTPLPLKGQVRVAEHGVFQKLVWEGQIKEVFLEAITEKEYLRVENHIMNLFNNLNGNKPILKNRDAVMQALEFAVDQLPDLNPSDIYQHIIYRIYLREYKNDDIFPEQVIKAWERYKQTL